MNKVYILHGWSYSTEKWEPLTKLFEQNGIKYEMLKIPGFAAPLSSVWTLNDYIDWLDRQVSKDKAKIVLLGHSNGARIAAAFAAKYPNKVCKLILVDSAGIIRKDLKTRLKKIIFGTIASSGKILTSSASMRNLLYKVIGEQDYNCADPTLKKTMINLISEDLESTFSKIKVPTLIIWGENDRITTVLDGREIHELISGSRFEIIENAKHSPQFTHPQEVASLILDFTRINLKTRVKQG